MLGAAHLEPSLVVVAVTAGLAVGVGMDGGQLALLMGAVLSGQLSVGWSNDWIDARRGRDDGRPDKPAATGAVARTTVQRAAVGALAGLTTVVMVVILGQTRVLFAMSRDGLLPRSLSRTGSHGTPVRMIDWRLALNWIAAQ